MARVRSLNMEVLQKFFAMVAKIYRKHDLEIHPEKVWSLDETGFNTNQGAKLCYYKRGTKEANILCDSGGKTMYTVLVCANASGDALPPLVVYKGKNLYDAWCKGGPKGTLYSASPSGWMEKVVFESWFMQAFVPYKIRRFGKEEFVVIFLDGHGSHLSFKAADAALRNNVRIRFLMLFAECKSSFSFYYRSYLSVYHHTQHMRYARLMWAFSSLSNMSGVKF
jgi:hypothetical protein